jgi:hypothetical protein
MSNDRCYLRSLRRRWALTQKDVAALLPSGDRNRVSRVERGLVPPSAAEIVAYRQIFGASVKLAFPRFYAATEDAVMQRAYRMHKRLERAIDAGSRRKRALAEQMLARATKGAKRHVI